MGMTKVWQGMAKKNRHMVRGGCHGVFFNPAFSPFSWKSRKWDKAGKN